MALFAFFAINDKFFIQVGILFLEEFDCNFDVVSAPDEIIAAVLAGRIGIDISRPLLPVVVKIHRVTEVGFAGYSVGIKDFEPVSLRFDTDQGQSFVLGRKAETVESGVKIVNLVGTFNKPYVHPLVGSVTL